MTTLYPPRVSPLENSRRNSGNPHSVTILSTLFRIILVVLREDRNSSWTNWICISKTTTTTLSIS